MTRLKVDNYLIIFFIGLIVTLLVGLGGNIVLKASLPASVSKTEVNFEKRLRLLENDLVSGNITIREYDSLADLLRLQIKRRNALQNENHNPDKMPEWVTKLGIIEPDGLKFDPVFSNYTSVDDPAEGFNSVSLVYSGNYEKAVAEATKIASNANLVSAGNFKAKGGPAIKNNASAKAGISFLNYSLGNTDKDFLISIEVEPSGRLTIMVTDNKQLNDRLLVYEPLNNRQNSAAKLKKQ
jgi:hypothetical protein